MRFGSKYTEFEGKIFISIKTYSFSNVKHNHLTFLILSILCTAYSPSKTNLWWPLLVRSKVFPNVIYNINHSRKNPKFLNSRELEYGEAYLAVKTKTRDDLLTLVNPVNLVGLWAPTLTADQCFSCLSPETSRCSNSRESGNFEVFL